MLIRSQSIPGLSNMRGTPLRDSTGARTLTLQDQSVAHIRQLPKVRVRKLCVPGLPMPRIGLILGDSVELTWMISWPLQNASELQILKSFAQSSLRYLRLQPVFNFLNVLHADMMQGLAGEL